MPDSRKMLALLGGLLCGSLTALGCFSERDGGPLASGARCSVPIATIDSMHHFIAMRDLLFRPDSVRVPPGATVTWVDCDDAGAEPHTATEIGGAWTSPLLSPGDRYSRRFPSGGTFDYYCTIHAGMAGTIVVQ